MVEEDIVRLFDLLPKEGYSGARDRDAKGGSFTTGLYARVKVSLRRNAKLYPNSTKVLSGFVRQVHPDHVFSSIIIFDSVETAAHVDSLNAPCDNLVVGLSDFSGGELWVEWPSTAPRSPGLRYETRALGSSSVLGALMPVAQHPIVFCAKYLRHETCPFEGRRVVLVAYSLQATAHADQEDRDFLNSLGFQMPGPSELTRTNVDPPRILHGTDGAPARAPSLAQVFSGDGSLASGFHKIGWDTLAIDRAVPPGKHKHQPLLCELATSAGQEFALKILKDFGPTVVYLRPPCRTANRARMRSFPSSHPASGQCPPLRSDDKPWGLQGLPPRQSAQVSSENALFRFCARVLIWALDVGAFVCLENPANSFLWPCLSSLPTFQSICERTQSCQGDLCMLGGSRPNSVRFLTNLPLPGLLKSCPGPSHKHAPFGLQPTDPPHPPAFVQCIVHACCSATQFRPAQVVARPGDEVRQRRRSRQLMPEFSKVLWLSPSSLPGTPHKVLRPDQAASFGAFKPLGVPVSDLVPPLLASGSSGSSSLAASVPASGSRSPSSPSRVPVSGSEFSPRPAALDDKVPVGIYATPEEFVDRSRALQHPMAGPSVVSDSFKRALFANLTKSPSEIAKLRASACERLKVLSEKLQPAEDELHRSFSPVLREVLKGKRLLLFKELLTAYQYDDPEVWKILRDGPTLTGTPDHPPYADRCFRPATLSTAQLERESAWRRTSVSSKTLSPQDAKTLTDLGAAEVESAFISGPYRSEDEVTQAVGRPDWIATPRFVLLQGARAKPRVIDDCRASGLNASFSSTERLHLQDLDYVVAMVRLAGRMSSKRSVRLDLSSGDTLCGDRVLPGDSEWVGRCVDLAKAYKQMAVPRSQRHLVVLCHHDPSGIPLYYVSESLPFGAEGSVYGFVRVSRAISFLINEALAVPSSVYFDDFPAISPRSSAGSASSAIAFLLGALGWRFSTDPEKARDFASCFDVLGCSLDLSGLAGPFGFVEVRNKPRRLDHIASLLDELGSGRGDYKLIPVIQGQLNFAANFVMGRAVSPLARSLSSAGSSNISGICSELKSLLRRAKPRKISWHSPDSPILIFTDAAYEAGKATIGAVVIDTLGGHPTVFDGTLPPELVSSWQAYPDEQIISQAELAAVVSVRYMLRTRLSGRKCFYFVDNEAARFSLIRAVSGVPSMQTLSSIFHSWDEVYPHFAWVERVPSASNPADLPSRGLATECIQRFRGHYGGGLCLPPGIESFNPLGNIRSEFEDCSISLTTIATLKD